ncbi:MAG: PadR family transcriptional regulator [Actinomycetia bacterium]|nr:PadR family transcriptional regulator [Actinomycetes bacterium]
MRAGGRSLSLTEWVVLAVAAEGTTHGFDIARDLDEEGDLGRIWTVKRPLVYRAIDSLARAGLLTAAGTEDGERGPQRQLLQVTPTGRRAVARWLGEPVAHVRDVRAELLLKLALLHRIRKSPAALLRRQREVLGPTVDGLRTQLEAAEGFDAVLARWRMESAEAVERFLDSL